MHGERKCACRTKYDTNLKRRLSFLHILFRFEIKQALTVCLAFPMNSQRNTSNSLALVNTVLFLHNLLNLVLC